MLALLIDAAASRPNGDIFFITSGLYDGCDKKSYFEGRSPIVGTADPNILNQINDVEVVNSDYNSLLADFAKFYLANKADVILIIGIRNAIIVVGLLLTLQQRGLIGGQLPTILVSKGSCPLPPILLV